ncbi:MAG: hypothetical protein ACK57H_09805, partial [Hyphomonadaceae bacterium]
GGAPPGVGQRCTLQRAGAAAGRRCGVVSRARSAPRKRLLVNFGSDLSAMGEQHPDPGQKAHANGAGAP